MRVNGLLYLTTLLSIASLSHAFIIYDEENCAACKINTAIYIQNHGYPVEIHTVLTSDFYVNTIFRISHGKNSTYKKGAVPILFQHGAYSSSDKWVSRFGSNESLAFHLADQGYDVWLNNFRFSRYANHQKYHASQFQYWNFTLEDIALEDLKSSIDYILKTTKQPSLCYVGHSMAALTITLLLSARPEYNDKVLYGQLFAPFVFSGNSHNLLLKIVCGYPPIFGYLKLKVLEFLVDNGSVNTILSMSTNGSKLAAQICGMPLFRKTCDWFVASIAGFNMESLPEDQLEIFFNGFGIGIPLKLAVHYAQIYSKGYLCMFDYYEKNIAIYGSSMPPNYNLSNVRVRFQIYCSKGDDISNLEDCHKFYKELVNANVTINLVEDEKFYHSAYFNGDFQKRAAKELHDSCSQQANKS